MFGIAGITEHGTQLFELIGKPSTPETQKQIAALFDQALATPACSVASARRLLRELRKMCVSGLTETPLRQRERECRYQNQ